MYNLVFKYTFILNGYLDYPAKKIGDIYCIS